MDWITGVLICGGKSRRFGSDKRFYRFSNETLFEFSYQLLKSVCKKVVCVFRDEVPGPLSAYPVLFDDLTLQGPMAAIVSALNHVQTKYILCLPCDMPNMTKECLSLIANEPEERSVVVSKTHILHPLVGRYGVNLYPGLKQFSKLHGFSLTEFILSLPAFKVKLLEQDFFEKQGVSAHAFDNLNSETDVCHIKKFSKTDMRHIKL